MNSSEIDAWLEQFKKIRAEGVDLDEAQLQIAAWQIEGMVVTLDHLRTVGDVMLAAGQTEAG